MELLKNKIDNTAQCAIIFPHTKWIISLDDIQCDTPNSSYDDIQYFDKEFFDDIEDPIKNIECPNNFINDVKDTDSIKEPIDDVKEPIDDVKEPIDDVREPIDDVKEPIDDVREPIDDVKEPVDDVKEPVDEVKEPIDDVKVNKIENKDIGPLEFFKQSLDLYEDDDIIKNKLFAFISNQKITNKYTKKGVSMIMDGITQDKWNIYICKLFSFLLDISFEYRKQNICYTNNSRFIIKK
jgi:archaellum component FlaC